MVLMVFWCVFCAFDSFFVAAVCWCLMVFDGFFIVLMDSCWLFYVLDDFSMGFWWDFYACDSLLMFY